MKCDRLMGIKYPDLGGSSQLASCLITELTNKMRALVLFAILLGLVISINGKLTNCSYFNSYTCSVVNFELHILHHTTALYVSQSHEIKESQVKRS